MEGGKGPIEFRAPLIPLDHGLVSHNCRGPLAEGWLQPANGITRPRGTFFLPPSTNITRRESLFVSLFFFSSGSKARHRERETEEEEESLQNKRRGTACSHGRRVESGQVCWHISANSVCIMRYVWSFCERFPDRLPATPRLGLCVLFLLLLLT